MHKGDISGEWEDILFRYKLSHTENPTAITVCFRISSSEDLITEWSNVMDDLVIHIADVCIDLPRQSKHLYVNACHVFQ